MTMAVEGAEDHKKLAEEDLKNIDLTSKDVVIGIAAEWQNAICYRRFNILLTQSVLQQYLFHAMNMQL